MPPACAPIPRLFVQATRCSLSPIFRAIQHLKARLSRSRVDKIRRRSNKGSRSRCRNVLPGASTGEVLSAETEPTEIHPLAVRAMAGQLAGTIGGVLTVRVLVGPIATNERGVDADCAGAQRCSIARQSRQRLHRLHRPPRPTACAACPAVRGRRGQRARCGQRARRRQ
jgi:hypothetical protein